MNTITEQLAEANAHISRAMEFIAMLRRSRLRCV